MQKNYMEICLANDHKISIENDMDDTWVLDVKKEDVSVLNEPCMFFHQETCLGFAESFKSAFEVHSQNQVLSDDHILYLLDVPSLLNFFNVPDSRVDEIMKQC